MPTTRWEPLEEADLDRVDAIQHVIHAGLPEKLDFLGEKRRLFPEGCRRLVRDGTMLGYAMAHPWILGSVPALNAPLGALPDRPDCLHMHDVAILPEGRGAEAAGTYVAHLLRLAGAMGIEALACVSVYGTGPLWGRHGFTPATARPPVASYGPDAVYMVRQVADAGMLNGS